MTNREKFILQQYDLQELLEHTYQEAELGSSLYKFHLNKDELKLYKGYKEMAKQLKAIIKKHKDLQSLIN